MVFVNPISKFFRADSKENLTPVKEKSYGREFEVSPPFTFSNAATIAANGGELLIDFEEDDSTTAKYLPFNVIEIFNGSSSKIRMFPNQDRTRGLTIPTGVTKVYTQDTIRFLRSVTIRNLDATNVIGIDELDILVQRDVTNVDSVIKRTHKKVFGGF